MTIYLAACKMFVEMTNDNIWLDLHSSCCIYIVHNTTNQITVGERDHPYFFKIFFYSNNFNSNALQIYKRNLIHYLKLANPIFYHTRALF